jgi:hypothetical protein
LLPPDHTLQQLLKVFLKVVDPLFFEPCHLGLDQARALVEFILGVSSAFLGLQTTAKTIQSHKLLTTRREGGS